MSKLELLRGREMNPWVKLLRSLDSVPCTRNWRRKKYIDMNSKEEWPIHYSEGLENFVLVQINQLLGLIAMSVLYL